MTRRAVLLAVGTRGDVEPFARLGRALRGRGWQVDVAVLADGAGVVRAAGLEPTVVGPASAEAMWSTRPAVRRASRVNPGLMYLDMRRSLARQAAGLARGLRPMLEPGPDHPDRPDLVVAGLATARLVPLLRDCGIPARLALLAPVTPHPGGTSTWGGALPDRLPRPVEQARQELLWRMTTGLSSALARELRDLAAHRGGPREVRGRAYPPLLATSPVLDPHPDPGVHQTGWWADHTPVTPLPAEVEAYLGLRDDVLLLTTGSLPHGRSPDAEATRLARVAREVGRPAVVQVPGARPGMRGSALVSGPLDHRALLPRVAAVLHHGGAGTTHAATAAGVAQVVVPELGDQGHYARQVHRLGIGPRPLPRGRATSRALVGRLRTALDPAFAITALLAGDRMKDEDGLAAAVAELGRSTP